MFSYTKRNVDTISLIISIIIFLVINNIYSSINQNKFSAYFESNENQLQIEISELNSIGEETKEQNQEQQNVDKKQENTQESTEKITEQNIEQNSNCNWQIEIPQISLQAEISEGTTQEVMNKYVGHFEDTPITEGNVCLAAHNRGYPVNYFANIKVLKEGDEIIYKYGNSIKTYIVDVIEIIEDTDWSYLENTEENKITLITCVENEPKYRRCIQGTEESNME